MAKTTIGFLSLPSLAVLSDIGKIRAKSLALCWRKLPVTLLQLWGSSGVAVRGSRIVSQILWSCRVYATSPGFAEPDKEQQVLTVS